jgi:transposase
MMSKREYQRDLMDVSPQVARKIEPDSVYRILHEVGPSLLQDEDFAEMYAEGEGRPSHPPSLMAGILLLQRHEDVSDREAIDRLKFDLRWQHALRLPMDFPEIPHSNLSHFRSRLIVHELEGQVFDRLAEMATEADIVDPGEEQAIDSSHIFGAAAVQDTYELLQDGTRKLLETALEEAPEEAEALIEDQGIEGRLSSEKPDIDWTSEEERREWLGEIVRDAWALLGALDGHPLVNSEAVQEAAELLSQILAQDITGPGEGDSGEGESGGDRSEEGSGDEVSGNNSSNNSGNNDSDGGPDTEEGPRIREGVATDRVISTVDPEMHHGRKSSSRRFDGYKVHITEAVESEFITAVAAGPGNQHDRDVAEELVQQVQKRFGQAPSVLIGDSHYGSPDLRAALEETLDEEVDEEVDDEKIEVVAKLPTATGGTGDRFDKTDFEIDLENGQVTCPVGHTTGRSHRARDHEDRPVERFQFDGDVCAGCPLRSECTSAKNGRTITLHYREEKVQEVRAYNETEEFDQRYRKRPKVEQKLSELLRRHGLRFGRYLGQKKTELQALLTAAVVNLKRAGTELIERLFSAGQMAPARG